MGATINDDAWEMPAIFRLMHEWGNVDWHEMYRTFNMGIGMVIIVDKDRADDVEKSLKLNERTAYRIGEVTRGAHEVTIKGGVFA